MGKLWHLQAMNAGWSLDQVLKGGSIFSACHSGSAVSSWCDAMGKMTDLIVTWHAGAVPAYTACTSPVTLAASSTQVGLSELRAVEPCWPKAGAHPPPNRCLP